MFRTFEMSPSVEDLFLLGVDIFGGVVFCRDEFVSEIAKCGNLLLLSADGFVEVLVLFDERLDVVAAHIVGAEEGLTGGHPVFSLFTISVEELKIEAFFYPGTPDLPCLLKRVPSLGHLVEFLLNLGARIMGVSQQLLSELFKSLERSLASINFRAVLLRTR